jgi:hypothetical protein
MGTPMTQIRPSLLQSLPEDTDPTVKLVYIELHCGQKAIMVTLRLRRAGTRYGSKNVPQSRDGICHCTPNCTFIDTDTLKKIEIRLVFRETELFVLMLASSSHRLLATLRTKRAVLVMVTFASLNWGTFSHLYLTSAPWCLNVTMIWFWPQCNFRVGIFSQLSSANFPLYFGNFTWHTN